MAEKNPEQELAAKVAAELENAGLLGSMSKVEFVKQLSAGILDAYAWKRMYEKAADQTEAVKRGTK
jgi:hypothetical protein